MGAKGGVSAWSIGTLDACVRACVRACERACLRACMRAIGCLRTSPIPSRSAVCTCVCAAPSITHHERGLEQRRDVCVAEGLVPRGGHAQGGDGAPGGRAQAGQAAVLLVWCQPWRQGRGQQAGSKPTTDTRARSSHLSSCACSPCSGATFRVIHLSSTGASTSCCCPTSAAAAIGLCGRPWLRRRRPAGAAGPHCLPALPAAGGLLAPPWGAEICWSWESIVIDNKSNHTRPQMQV